jgi:hypothetical protein
MPTVLDLPHVVTKRGGHESVARVAPWLHELRLDVLQREQAHVCGNVALPRNALHGLRVSHEGADVLARLPRDPLHEIVALRVHRARIERMAAAADSDEPGALLERLRAEARDREKVAATRVGAMLVAVLHDLLGERLSDARDLREQRRARRVQLDAHRVDAADDDLVELALQERLEDVVLVLTHADRLRVDLHELGERVLEPPRDRHGAAHGEIEVRELLARDVAR